MFGERTISRITAKAKKLHEKELEFRIYKLSWKKAITVKEIAEALNEPEYDFTRVGLFVQNMYAKMYAKGLLVESGPRELKRYWATPSEEHKFYDVMYPDEEDQKM